MGGGVSRGPQPGYNEIEYSTPWPGLQLDKPSNAIDFGAVVSCNASSIRGRLTCQPAIYPITAANPLFPVVVPPLTGQTINLITSLPITQQTTGSIQNEPVQQAFTILVSPTKIYADYAIFGTTKTFVPVFTFPSLLYPVSCRFSSVVIGGSLYLSSATAKSIWKVTQSSGVFTVTEITAQNGSGPFIGADFLGTLSGRLIAGCIIGGDGNTTGIATGVDVTAGGSGWPASGTFTVVGGGGSGAAGTYTTSGGSFTVGSPSPSFTFTSSGESYVPNSGAQIALGGTPGTGFAGTLIVSAAVTPSTTTLFPDYFAWSFPNAFGQFDPNNAITPGGFQQITEARGIVTGFTIFQSVLFMGHNGGITEVTPNTTSNLTPWTYNPLWSADQGVIVRYGSMTQYGDTAAFLSNDSAYMLSPNGLTPIGGSISFLLTGPPQPGTAFNAGAQPQLGLFGSIVQIDGEKHYLVTMSQLTGEADQQDVRIYDYNFSNQSWFEWDYPDTELTSPLYQSYDQQTMANGASEQVAYDSWILGGFISFASGGEAATLNEFAVGQRLLNIQSQTSPPDPVVAEAFACQFRSETPGTARLNQERRIVVEYENIPQLAGTTATVVATLTGQNSPSLSLPAAATQQITWTLSLPYPTTPTVPNQILTVQSEPIGPALTTCGTTLSLLSASTMNLVRVTQVCALQKGEIQ